jgi:hypothetical protein
LRRNFRIIEVVLVLEELEEGGEKGGRTGHLGEQEEQGLEQGVRRRQGKKAGEEFFRGKS